MINKSIPIILLLFLSSISFGTIKFSKASEVFKTKVFKNEFTNMVIQSNYLFVINARSLEIFDISHDSLLLLTDYELQGELVSISVKDDFAYIATSSYSSRIYRLDISNITAPIVTDTLHFKGSYVQFIDGENVFIHELLKNNTWIAHVYDNISFVKITEIEIPHKYWPFTYITGGKAVISEYETTYLYDISNPSRVRTLGKSEIGQISFPNHLEIMNDTVLVIASNSSGLKTYNVSDQTNWKLISSIEKPIFNFRINNDKLIAISSNERFLYKIDNTSEITLLDKEDFNSSDNNMNLTVINNDAYFTTARSTIAHIIISNNKLETVELINNFGSLISSFVYNDFLIIQSEYNGISVWNITKPENPESIGYYFQKKTIYNMTGDSNIIITIEYNKDNKNFENVIYRISDEGTLLKIAKVPVTVGVLFYNRKDGFFSLGADGTLSKHSLNNNILEIIKQQNIPDIKGGGYLYFYRDHLYTCSPQGIIAVIRNDVNDFKLISTFNSYMNYITDIEFVDNFLILSQSSGVRTGCMVVDISNPINLKWHFAIGDNGSSCVDKENNLLLLANYGCNIYSIEDIENKSFKKVFFFQNSSKTNDIKIFENSEKKYLLYLEDCSARIYEYLTD